jgi:hypothetical protein
MISKSNLCIKRNLKKKSCKEEGNLAQNLINYICQGKSICIVNCNGYQVKLGNTNGYVMSKKETFGSKSMKFLEGRESRQ